MRITGKKQKATMSSLFTQLRFLPITIFAAALMLTVKMGEIWDGIDGAMQSGISVSVAQAQAPNMAPAPPPPPPAAPAAAPATAPAAAAEGEGKPAAAAPAEPVVPPLGEDPTLLTQAEIDLLQQLAERRETIEKREKQMEVQTGLLRAAESRIDKKVDELRKLQATIEKLIKTYDDQQDLKMQSLVKVYEAMKPKDAAQIFEQLDMTTLLAVAERMKERKLASVMSKMDPARAKEVTVELTRLRELPQGDEIGG